MPTMQRSTREVQQLLEDWGYQPFCLPLLGQTVQGFSEKLYLLDSNKVLYLQVATDNLRDPPEASQLANWDIVQLGNDLEQRKAEMIRHLSTLGVSKDRIMTLTVLQPCRQVYVNNLMPPIGDTIHLIMSASHLKAIVLVDLEDHLALWKYGKSHHWIRESMPIISTDPLDEYEFYRRRPKGYFLPEELVGLPLRVPPGAGLEIIKEIHEKLDPHVVPSFVPGKLIEVWNVRSSDAIPISAPPPASQMQMPLVVEGELPLPVWIVLDRSVSNWPTAIPDVIVRAFASMVWRFEELVERWISSWTTDSKTFVIRLAFEPITDWGEVIEIPNVQGEASESPVLSLTRTETGTTVRLYSSLLGALGDPSLQGIRILAREFLLAMQEVADLASRSDEDVVTDAELERLIDSKLPPGQIRGETSKRLQDSLILGDSLERLIFRPVQEADEWMFREMGWRHLRDKFELKGLLTTVEDRCKVINALVGYFYGELEARVKTLDGIDTMMKLISCNEANVFQTEDLSIRAPVLSSAASNSEAFIEVLMSDRATLDQANLSNRFLIEYVSASLPDGDQPLTMEAFDKLQALSSLICEWGGFSDYVKFGLIDEDMELRPSGRLIWDTSVHRRSSRTFNLNFTRGRISESKRDLDAGRLEAEEIIEIGESSPESEALNEAYKEEFGLSLKELGNLIGEVVKLGRDQEGPAKQLPTLELVTPLARSLRWTREKVLLGLGLLTLAPRHDFLKPPGGNQSETYPWRYSRVWSHLRRPLIRTGCDLDSLTIWGNRSLVMTLYHLDELCISGRINARTQRLKRAVTKIRQLEAAEFEALVSDNICKIDGVKATRGVKKIGKRRIGRPGPDLGDIDVLCVIPELRVVLCIECKDFSLARTAAEIQHQMEEIVTGSRGKAPTVEKHLKRVEWVRVNLDYVLKECFDIDRKGCWRVKPMLVSDGELYATYLRSLPFENWTLERLRSATKSELAST